MWLQLHKVTLLLLLLLLLLLPWLMPFSGSRHFLLLWVLLLL
jgi:hypothetical protein